MHAGIVHANGDAIIVMDSDVARRVGFHDRPRAGDDH